jgi:hypothetical protein
MLLCYVNDITIGAIRNKDLPLHIWVTFFPAINAD